MEKKTNGNPGKTGQMRAPDDDADLTPRQLQALGALLDSPSIVAAAGQVGIDESTIRRWIRNDPSFRSKLRELRTEALTGASYRLQTDAFAVVEVLNKLILGKKKIEPGRAALIRTALDYAFKAGGYVDLVERVAALETPLEGEDDSRDSQ